MYVITNIYYIYTSISKTIYIVTKRNRIKKKIKNRKLSSGYQILYHAYVCLLYIYFLYIIHYNIYLFL